MKRFLGVIFVGLMVTFSAFADQRADHFVIEDADFFYEFKVDENWFAGPRNASRFDHIWLAPGGDHAGCVIHAQQTLQYDNIAANDLEQVVNDAFDKDFFVSHVPVLNIGQNDALNVSLAAVQDGGLGKGFSRYVLADYTALSGVEKRALMFASWYGDMRMVVSCQAAQDTINNHLDAFTAFVDSITFEDGFRPYPTLYYRDFLSRDRGWLEILFNDFISLFR